MCDYFLLDVIILYDPLQCSKNINQKYIGGLLNESLPHTIINIVIIFEFADFTFCTFHKNINDKVSISWEEDGIRVVMFSQYKLSFVQKGQLQQTQVAIS